MPYVQTNDIRTYYESFGDGKPLVLIGGSVFGRRNWAMAWDAFAKEFEVISYDQRGYGRSDRPLERYTMEVWIDDVAAMLDALDIQRAHIAGTSMGAMVALAFAAKYPERCIGVVSDCPMVKPDRARKLMFETWRRMVQVMGCGDALADHVVVQAVSADLLDSDRADAVIANVRAMITQNSVETVVQACLMMEELDLTGEIEKIEAPTLVIASTQDYITPIETAKSGAGSGYIARKAKHVRFHVNDDCGHADLLEKKDQTIAMIIDFLKQAENA